MLWAEPDHLNGFGNPETRKGANGSLFYCSVKPLCQNFPITPIVNAFPFGFTSYSFGLLLKVTASSE